MGTEAERQDTRKAMAYDLEKLIDERQDISPELAAELKKMIRTYIDTANQK